MEFARKWLALGCALGVAGCAQGGLGSSSGPGGASVLLPDGARIGATMGRMHRQSGPGVPQIYIFQGTPDAESPTTGLVNIGSTLYGTSTSGGANNLGAVYSVTTGGAEAVVHSFAGGADGVNPDAPLTKVKGTLYGTTYQQGAAHGTVFRIAPSGGYKIVYNFGVTAGDCDEPDTAMIYVPSQKAMYGTAYGGGANGEGCIYKLSLGRKTVQESIVYSFTGAASSSTGASAPVFFKNALYVTTPSGGAHNYGAVLKVTLSGHESVVYSFKYKPDGANPHAALLALGDALYGTTGAGGKGACGGYAGCGTIFKLTSAGKEKVLYRFKDSPTVVDGGGPQSQLMSVGGVLYGTAPCTGPGCSSVLFSESPSGGNDTIVYDFGDTASTPAGYPINAFYGPPLSLDGKFYGTSSESSQTGYGTVWVVPQ